VEDCRFAGMCSLANSIKGLSDSPVCASFICMYVCIYIYIYIYACIHVHICMYVCVYIYIYIYANSIRCLSDSSVCASFISIYVCLCMYVYNTLLVNFAETSSFVNSMKRVLESFVYMFVHACVYIAVIRFFLLNFFESFNEFSVYKHVCMHVCFLGKCVS
jgi:hypothetical protein